MAGVADARTSAAARGCAARGCRRLQQQPVSLAAAAAGPRKQRPRRGLTTRLTGPTNCLGARAPSRSAAARGSPAAARGTQGCAQSPAARSRTSPCAANATVQPTNGAAPHKVQQGVLGVNRVTVSTSTVDPTAPTTSDTLCRCHRPIAPALHTKQAFCMQLASYMYSKWSAQVTVGTGMAGTSTLPADQPSAGTLAWLPPRVAT